MPLKKNYRRRKPMARKPIKSRKSMISRRPSTNIHHYKRMLTGDFANWGLGLTRGECLSINGNAVHNPWRGAFQLNGISGVVNASDFTNLYDQYCIKKLVLKFYLKVDSGAQTAATASVPRLYWYRDYDDSNAPANLNEIRENGKSKVAVLSLYKPVTIVLRPNTLQLIYQSTIANQYKPVFNQWLDMATSNTPHYCLKLAIDDLTNTNYRVDVEPTLYFACKQSR